MNITSKLIFLLTITVGAVMLFSSFLFLLQREAGLENALRDELRAHAITLQTALEENYSENRKAESQRLIDRLRRNTKVYSVTLIDEKRNIVKSSHPETKKAFRTPSDMKDVFTEGKTIEFNYQAEDRKFISFILPIRIGDEITRALIIVKPLDLIEQEIFYARLNWLAITLFLLAVIFSVVILVLKNSLTKPIYELLKGAEKIGSGNLDYRVKINKNGDELDVLASNFNQMADNLAQQRQKAKDEAQNRLNLERELRHSERLAAVGRLAAGVAHELGTPLNVIDARAGQILDKPELSKEKKERNLKTIRRQTDRITHLVQQLLNLARPFNLKFTKIDVKKHIEETISQIFTKDDQIDINFLTEETFYIKADNNYLQQVWINILQNAKQAILKNNDEGSIQFEMKLNEAKEGRFISVEFKDSGDGIESEHLEKIFDPFYTTKDIGQGTGLGLTVSHRILEEHNGTIEASNNENGGASFTVTLPIWKKD